MPHRMHHGRGDHRTSPSTARSSHGSATGHPQHTHLAQFGFALLATAICARHGSAALADVLPLVLHLKRWSRAQPVHHLHHSSTAPELISPGLISPHLVASTLGASYLATTMQHGHGGCAGCHVSRWSHSITPHPHPPGERGAFCIIRPRPHTHRLSVCLIACVTWSTRASSKQGNQSARAYLHESRACARVHKLKSPTRRAGLVRSSQEPTSFDLT